MIFHSFSLLSIERRVSVFLLKLFDGVVKTEVHLSKETFCWKWFFFEKTEKISQTLQTLSKIFLTFCRKWFGGISNLDSTCRYGTFWIRKVFLEKYRHTHLFESWAKLSMPLFGKNSLGLSSLNLLFHGILLKEKNSWKMLFHSFRTLSKQFPVFCPDFFNRVFGTAVFLSIKTFWWIKDFVCWKEKQNFTTFRHRAKTSFDFWSKTFGLWAKNFQPLVGKKLAGRQNCHSPVHGIFSRFKKDFWGRL